MSTLWADLVESVRGTEMDFTSGRLGRAILLLSVPMVLETLMEAVFALVDIFFVSRLGSDAVATVGITESFMTIIYALGTGLSIGTTAVISRRIGQKRAGEAADAAVQSILAGILFALPIMFVGFIYAQDFLRLMGASDEIVSSGYRYTSIMLGTNVVIILLHINNAVFRSAGDAVISMRVMWLANLINIVLDPCLIFGLGPFPEMGIRGAAIATCLGRGLAVIYQFYLLYNRPGRIRVRPENIRFQPRVIYQIIRLSMGGIGQYLIATSSWIFLVRITSIFGSAVLAGYTIAIRIIIFAMLPAWGLANAAATLTGQNLGAGKPDRAERSVQLTALANILFLGVIAVFLLINPAFFIRLFLDDREVILAGARCLRIISYGFLFYGFGMVMIQAFNGAGDTATPTRINFIFFWLLEIPLAYLLAVHTGLEERGVYFAILLCETLVAVTAYLLFRRGKWKLREV